MITLSNREDLWESEWNIAFREGGKEQLGTTTFVCGEERGEAFRSCSAACGAYAKIQKQGTRHEDHPYDGKLGVFKQEQLPSVKENRLQESILAQVASFEQGVEGMKVVPRGNLAKSTGRNCAKVCRCKTISSSPGLKIF